VFRQYGAGIRLDFAERYGPKTASAFETKIEATNTREQGQDLEHSPPIQRNDAQRRHEQQAEGNTQDRQYAAS
jgi:hypothetical protein